MDRWCYTKLALTELAPWIFSTPDGGYLAPLNISTPIIGTVLGLAPDGYFNLYNA